MLEFWVIYEDDPGAPNFTPAKIESGPIADTLFEAVAKSQTLNGRPVKAAWTCDDDSEQGAAIKAFGSIAIHSTSETIRR